MPISVRCPSCGKKLKAPDSAAGKRAKCPQCGNAIKVPERVYDAEEVVDEADDYEDYEDYQDGDSHSFGVNEYETPAVETRRPCPMCGEMIVAKAAKCRYCGEIFDATLKRKKKKKKKRRRSSSYFDDDEMTAFDWFLCIACSNIGCIVGIVALCSGNSSRGGKMIGLSIMFNVIWGVVFNVLSNLGQ